MKDAEAALKKANAEAADAKDALDAAKAAASAAAEAAEKAKEAHQEAAKKRDILENLAADELKEAEDFAAWPYAKFADQVAALKEAEKKWTDAVADAENKQKAADEAHAKLKAAEDAKEKAASDLLAAKVNAQMKLAFLYGENSTVTRDGKSPLEFGVNGDLPFFTKLIVDGSEVDVSVFKAVRGSSLFTVDGSYLADLKTGSHDLTISYKYGDISTTFKLVEPEKKDDQKKNDQKPAEPAKADNTGTKTNTGNTQGTNITKTSVVTSKTGASSVSAKDSSKSGGTAVKREIPKTADESRPAGLNGIFAAAGLAMIGCLYRKKEEE